MKILFSHNNYPSQFRRILPLLVHQGHEVKFIASSHEWHAPNIPGIDVIFYNLHRASDTEWLHPYLRRFESCVLEGQAAYRCAISLMQSGWLPDVIVSHAGFGNGFFLGDLFPNAKRIGLFEWYYNSINSDVDFFDRPNQVVDLDRGPRVRCLNAAVLLELANCDTAIVPTLWQKNQFPLTLRDKMSVIHEGIDFDFLSSLRCSDFDRPSCLPPDPNIQVLTYVSRGFEEYRGFPQVMQAIVELQKLRPNLHCLIVGADVIAYGKPRTDGRTWGAWAKEDLTLDPLRTHWLGSLQEKDYHAVLRISDVHVYFTIPFVLSWSLLESLASGCSVVASNTSPVQEVITSQYNGLLVDFFDKFQLVNNVLKILDDPQLRHNLSIAATKSVRCYSQRACTAKWLDLIVRGR